MLGSWASTTSRCDALTATARCWRTGKHIRSSTAAQVRRAVEDLIDMGRWHAGDRDIPIVFDAGYDAPRMAHLAGRTASGGPRADAHGPRDAQARPVPWISPPPGGQPPKDGKEFRAGQASAGKPALTSAN
ncbi:transposase [Streptomyces sp. NPDC006602]|uniref:transposase n=1 Tax=Streptomyces sp. NPDC006602 TaxID=3364751 RepID=UPI003673BD17